MKIRVRVLDLKEKREKGKKREIKEQRTFYFS